MGRQSKIDFGSTSIPKLMLRTSLPMLAADVLSLLYNIVDRIYIGRISSSGASALGAIGLCFPIIIITIGFANMFGQGGGPLFSMELGRQNPRKAEALLNTALRLICLTALLIMLFGELFSRPILALFGADEAAMPISLPYLRIYLLGTLFSMLATGMNPFVNAQGYPNVGMLSVAVGTVLNILLDPIFIFRLGLGVEGAAIATVISQAISAAITLVFLLRVQKEFRITRPKPGQPCLPHAGDIISLGTASFIMSCTNSFVSISCNKVLMHFGGAAYVSVMTIISSVRQILDTPAQALTNGCGPILSYSYGSRASNRIRQTIRIMTVFSICYTGCIWLLIQFLPGMFIGVFTPDPQLKALAAPALHIYFFAFVFQSLQYSGQIVFKSLGKKKQTIFFSLLRKVVLVIPLTYLLPYVFGFGTDGVFMAEPISNALGGTACFVTMVVLIKKELKAMEV